MGHWGVTRHESRRRILGPQGAVAAGADATATAVAYLYGTEHCHLCERARALIEQLPEAASWRLIARDVVDDDALFRRYVMRVPVLQRADDGRELDWPFDAEAVRRLLGRVDR